MGLVLGSGEAGASLAEIGRSAVFPLRRPFQRLAIHGEPAALRRQIRERCPARAGVYGFIDRSQSLVYVGVSSKLRARLVTYFQSGDAAAARKEHAVAGQAVELLWQVIGHEFAAQLRELELIRRYQPRLNVRGRWPGRPLGYIYVSAEAAPRLRVAGRVPKGARHSWGPLSVGGRVREAIELVNRLFKLCDCPSSVLMHFADERLLFPLELRMGCLRGETGSCLGPCAGGCTRSQYSTQIRAARALLDGRDDSMIRELEERLADAALRQRFEQAARLRDSLECLETLMQRLARLREPAAPSEFVYPITIGRRPVWYFVAAGVARSAAVAPATARAAWRCLKLLERSGRPRVSPVGDVDRSAAQIVSSWFHLRPEESARILLPEAAREECERVLVA
jgi:excinuclease ABC subunit C